eukprot:12655454-Heterocapsa_arctica.AAC.1
MERGTKITTLNVSGSQLTFEWILENTEDHIVFIQEHWRLPNKIGSWKSAAFRKGWTGVWHPAIRTQKTVDGIPGISGEVAILVWSGRTIMKSTLISDHRLIGASIAWGRKKTMHVICIYGLDTGQTNTTPEEGNKVLRSRISEHLAKIGRAPW